MTKEKQPTTEQTVAPTTTVNNDSSNNDNEHGDRGYDKQFDGAHAD